MDILSQIKNQIIVSVQAMPSEPLYEEQCLLAMMKSVVNGGAKALRLAGSRDIKNAKLYFKNIPVIGITKPEKLPIDWKNRVYITPAIEDAKKIIDSGADIIAFDATQRHREKDSLASIIDFVKNNKKIAMADISTFDEGIKARDFGADVISTTLSGYTKESDSGSEEPDFVLLDRLVKELDCPVILEGKVWTPEQVDKAFDLGAHSVVIGSAITRPQLIVKRFCNR